MTARSRTPTRSGWNRPQTLDWIKKPTVARKYDWDTDRRRIEHTWFEDGQLNISVNCLDRHLQTDRRTKPALVWQGEPEEDAKTLTYEQLHAEVCKFANVLKSLGVKKGDRVAIYMPMIPGTAGRHARLRAASGRSIRSCSAASAPTRWPAASTIPPASC